MLFLHLLVVAGAVLELLLLRIMTAGLENHLQLLALLLLVQVVAVLDGVAQEVLVEVEMALLLQHLLPEQPILVVEVVRAHGTLAAYQEQQEAPASSSFATKNKE